LHVFAVNVKQKFGFSVKNFGTDFARPPLTEMAQLLKEVTSLKEAASHFVQPLNRLGWRS